MQHNICCNCYNTIIVHGILSAVSHIMCECKQLITYDCICFLSNNDLLYTASYMESDHDCG